MNKTSKDTFQVNDMNYERVVFKRARLLPYSRLHHIEPVGIGTPYVESMSGFIIRLAEAHCVFAGVLLVREIAPLVNRYFSRLSEVMQGAEVMSKLKRRSRDFNGKCRMTRDLTGALETLTLRDNLRFLTLLPWSKALSNQPLLKEKRTWCPECFEERRHADDIIYQPLIWALRSVTVCPLHRRELESVCPDCHRSSFQLTSRARSGHCYLCGHWLGRDSRADREGERRGVSAEEWDYRLWAAKSVGELVEAGPKGADAAIRENVTKGIRLLIDRVAEGYPTRFARLCDAALGSGKQWERGALPSLEAVLKICFYTGVGLTDFLTGRVEATHYRRETLRKKVENPRVYRWRRGLVTSMMREAYAEEFPPSVDEIARRLGYRSMASLYVSHNELCKKISSKRRAAAQDADEIKRFTTNHKGRKKVDADLIASAMKLALKENPPPPVSAVAARLNIQSRSTIKRKCPRLYARLTKRHGSYLARLKRERVSWMRGMIEAALAEDPAPHIKEVARRLGFKTPSAVVYRFPDLARVLRKRYEESKKDGWEAVLRRLQEALNEDPAPSLLSLSREVGLDTGTLHNRYRELSRKVAARHTEYRREQSRMRQEQWWSEAREVAVALQREGISPTYERIEKHLARGSSLGFRYQNWYRKVREEVGLSPEAAA